MAELDLLARLLLFALAFLGLGLAFETLAARLLARPLGLFELLALGIGAALPLTFLLASAGALSRMGAWLLAGAALLGLAFGCPRRWAELVALLRRPSSSAAGLAPLAMLGAALVPLYWVATDPTVHWDAAVYHLTLPRHYLETGGFAPLEMNVYSYWPHGPQLLYAFGLLFGGPPLAKLLHFGCGLLILALLHQALRRGGQPFWRFGAWVAITGFLMHPVVLFEMRSAYVDLFQTLFFLAAFLFLSGLRESPEAGAPGPVAAKYAGGYLLLAGVACGAAAVCKPTAILFLPALLIPMLLPWWLAERRGGRALALLLTRFAPPILVLALPWAWRSFRLTGNPVYPFFWEIFGGPDWDSELAAQFLAWQRGIGMGRGFFDYLLLPWRVLTQGRGDYAHFDGRLALPLVLLLLVALWRAARPEPPRLLRPALLVSALYFLLWAMSSQQMRFLIPILPLLAIAGGLAAADLAGRFGRRPVLAPALALLLPLMVWSDPELLAQGLGDAASYRSEPFEAGPEGEAPFREPMLALPADAKILLINWNQGYYVPRPFLADSFFEASQITAWLSGVPESALPARLAERGITHVLYHRGSGPSSPPALIDILDEILADEAVLRPVWASPKNGEWQLLELVR